MNRIVYYKNDNLLELTGLRDVTKSSTTFVNNATVTADLKDSDGVAIGSQLTLAYVTSSDGDYRATVPDTLSVDLGDDVTAEITADAGAGLRAFWDAKLHIEKRVA